jgi:hypothetical protein
MTTTPSQLVFVEEVQSSTIGDQVPNPSSGDLALFPNQNGSWYSKNSSGTVAALTGVASVFGRTGTVTATSGDYTVAQVTGAAPLASPALTGTPTAPTAAFGTNTTQIATTAFVQSAEIANVVSTTFTSNAYTLALTDAQTSQQASNGSTAATLTVPPNASVAFPVGSWVEFTQTGTGKIQIAQGSGVTINCSVAGGFVSGTTGCRVEYSVIRLLKVATNTWTLSGDVA